MSDHIEDAELYCGAFLVVTSKIVKETIAFASENPTEVGSSEFYLDVLLDIAEINYSNTLNITIIKTVEIPKLKSITTAYVEVREKRIPILQININEKKLKLINCFNKSSVQRSFKDGHICDIDIRERNLFLFSMARGLAKEFV